MNALHVWSIFSVLWARAAANVGLGNPEIVEVLVWSGGDGAGFSHGDIHKAPNYLGHDVDKREWNCPVDCRFTADKSRLGVADGVYFTAQPITGYYDEYKRDPPQFPHKFPHQYWINSGYEQENYFHLYGDPGYLDYVDVNMTFQQSSQVPITLTCDWGGYGGNISQFLRPPGPKTKEKGIVMMITNCYSGGGYMRIDYLRQLMRYIDVDSYGQCLHNKDLPFEMQFPIYSDHGTSMRNKITMFKDYMFVVAFENNNVTDYVSEKMCNVLQAGAVPIYMGAPNVHPDWTPGEKSIIQTDHFKSPKDLAKYLHYLMDNEEEYNKYFAWKKKGLSWQFKQRYADCEFYGAECRLCKHILGRRLALQHRQLIELEERKKAIHQFHSLLLNGRSQYVTVPAHSKFDLTKQMAFATWIRPTSIESGTILSRGEIYSLGLKRIWKRTFVELCVLKECFYSGQHIVLDQWVFISVSYRYEEFKAGRVAFFVNGRRESPNNNEPTRCPQPSDYADAPALLIGTNAAKSDFFRGELDDTSLWNVDKSDRDHHLFVYRMPSVAEKGLVAFWSYNQEPGETVFDTGFWRTEGTAVDGPEWPEVSTKPLVTSAKLS